MEHFGIDPRVPKHVAYLHAILEQAVESLAAERHYEDVRLVASRLLVILCIQTCLFDGENSIYSKRNAHAGNLTLPCKHADQVVVSAAGGDTADTHRRVIRAIIIL